MEKSYKNKSLAQNHKNEGTGSDHDTLLKAAKLSALYYNEGLKRAKIRDLTGAIICLKNSLKLNKLNTDARNLLGLIYSEMGDTVASLGEWVISRHFNDENNPCEEYLSYFQRNPTRLDGANKVIKKYNSAIKSLHTDSEDLAIIQLKKVIALNPRHVKALQLLSLLYIKNKRYSEAAKHLKTAKKIDVCNPTTLLYLNELKAVSGITEKTVEVKPERVLFADSDSFAPASSYKEDKPSVLPWINLVLGIALGAAFFAVAMLPGIKAKSVEGKLAEIVSLNESLSEANNSLSQLESRNDELSKEIESLKRKYQSTEAKKEEKKKEEEKEYKKELIDAANFFMLGDEKQAAESLIKIDKEKLKEKESLALYNNLTGKVFEKQALALFNEGRSWYNKGRFDKATPILTESYKMNSQNVETVYYLGRAYDRLGEKEKAKEWYTKVIDEFGTTARASDAKYKLRLLGGN